MGLGVWALMFGGALLALLYGIVAKKAVLLYPAILVGAVSGFFLVATLILLAGID
jgi:hypothetical protein